MYVCMYVCVAQGHLVKTPTVSPSHLPHAICQSFLLSNSWRNPPYTNTHTHSYTHSSEANMTKVDSRKLHDGPLKPSRGSWWNTLQLPVIQPCRTEWPKWPPGATATVNWTECVTVNTPVLSSVSRSLALCLFFFLYSLQMNSTRKCLHNSPLRRWYHFYGAILFKG